MYMFRRHVAEIHQEKQVFRAHIAQFHDLVSDMIDGSEQGQP